MKISVLKLLNQARMKRKPAAVITRITDGKQSLFVDNKIVAGAKVEKPFKTQIESALMKDVSISIGKSEDRIFINVFNPPKRLILIGAVHISQALAPMAQTVGKFGYRSTNSSCHSYSRSKDRRSGTCICP